MITSPRNRKVDAAAKLRRRAFRERERRFLVEGPHAVEEALGSSVPIATLFHTEAPDALVERAADDGAETLRVSEPVMARLASTVTPQGLVAVVPFVDVALDRIGADAGCVAILAAVRDPGNVGTVLRSADAAGAGGVVVSSASVDVYNPKAVRASAGSLFHLPLVRGIGTEEAVTQLRSRGFSTIAASPDAGTTLWDVDLSVPVAFLFGNEAWGLPDDVAALAERTVRFPQAARAESLNLAAAATLFLFEWARRRAEAARPAFETLIAAAAHDIRSPLTAMKGFGFALSRRWHDMSDEQRDAMLQAIVYDTERMNGIVRQLVDAARIASGRLELFPEQTDVTELVEGVAGILARDPEHPRVVWHGPRVRGLVDRERLRTVLGAFFEAAVWWASEGDIGVRAERRGQRLRLEVGRAGTQLSAEDAEALFRPRQPGSGAGSKIGLYVARGIAELMGGTAAANVTADGRVSFVLDVPSPDRLPGSG